MGAPVSRRAARLLAGMLVLLGLALLEWLGGQVLGGDWSAQGVLAGLALGAVMLLLALATRRVRGELAAASVAALSAVGELALGAVVVFALAAAAAALLPLPLSASFLQGERTTDFIVFGACALALLVAGRATCARSGARWRRNWRRRRRKPPWPSANAPWRRRKRPCCGHRWNRISCGIPWHMCNIWPPASRTMRRP